MKYIKIYLVWPLRCMEQQKQKTKTGTRIKYIWSTNHRLSSTVSTKTNYCRAVVTVFKCSCLCVNPPAVDGIRHPACWQQLRLVCELHLPSRKDNQPTGVFNLKYARWTMDHFAQPLHTAQRQDWTLLQSLTGEHISSVVLMYCHSKGSNPFSSNSHKIKCTVRLRFNSWDEEIVSVWRLHLASDALLEDCSVKCLGWSLNSSCQHQFTDPMVEAVVEENVIHAGKNRKLIWRSERK